MASKRYDVIAKCYDKRGMLISLGKNSYTKTHPLQAHYAKMTGNHQMLFLHAEIAALLKAGTKQVHKIVVERFTVDGRPANAKPCAVCSAAIKDFGVVEIEHTKQETT
jgi:deoxycytidylate deaminase